MVNTGEGITALFKELSKIERFFIKELSLCNGNVLIYKCCPAFDYDQWKHFNEEHSLEGWSVIFWDDMVDDILDRILLWEMERVKKNSLTLCVASIYVESQDVDMELLISQMEEKIDITDYLFKLKDKRIVIIFTDTPLLNSKRYIQEIFNSLNKIADIKLSAGIVCYKGKRGVSAKDLLMFAEKSRLEALDKKEVLGVAPVLNDKPDKDLHVTIEEKKFLFSSI